MERIHLALENLLSTDKFEIKHCRESDLGNGLLGFLGDHSKLIVTYILNGVESEVSLFLKEYPKQNIHRAAYNDEYNTFFRETTFYKNLTKLFINYDENEIWHSKCLYVDEKTFIFEDLCKKGFKMQDLYKGLDDDHCRIALDAIAKMHTAYIILEETEASNELELLIKDNRFKSNFLPNIWLKATSTAARVLVEHSTKYGKSTNHFEKVLQEWDKVYIDTCVLSAQPQKVRTVLNHMDLWNNNLMFRYKNDSPVQCIIVDYQAYIVTSPAVDVMSFLYMNLDPKDRTERVDYLIEYYYTKFCELLSSNGLEAANILGWESFKESCERYRTWGLLHGIILFPFLFMDQETVNETINDSENFFKQIQGDRRHTLITMLKENPVFKYRMMSNIDEFIGRSIIKDIP